MKAINRGNGSSCERIIHLARAFIVAGFLFCAGSGLAQLLPLGGNSYPSNTLWLSVAGVSNEWVNLILHGTTPGTNYVLLSKQALTDPSWNTVGTITGAMDQDWTPVSVPVGAQSSCFFQAQSAAGQTSITNLWIAQVSISSGSLVGIVTNSQADISYEIQSLTDLTQAGAGWGSEGFIPGSELTNWTPMSVAQNGRTNLFLRIKSWADSTGCGIPDWWQLQYFGYVGVDPYALDSAGDGWTIYQKFQMGLNPNVFYTPPAPQNLTVNYNSSNGTATVSWLPSPGAVTNYTVNFNGTDYNVPASVNSFTAAISLTPWDIAYDGPSVYTYFGVQGNYAGGSSSQGSTSLAMDYPNEVGVIPGPQGSSYLVASPSTLPPGTTAIRLTRVDQYAEWFYGNSSFDTYWDIPVSSLTNGLYLIPTYMQTAPMDSYGSVWYLWWVETVDANGTANSWANPASGYYNPSMTNWFEPPYYDGRVHLKQNLIFQLRSAQVDSPFQINEFYPSYTVSINFPANYAYAGFYQYDNFNNGAFNALLPFIYNYTYRNFVYSVSDLSTGGLLNSLTNYLNTFNFGLTEPPPYYFQLPATATNLTPIPSLLDTNTTRWLGIGLTCYLDYYSDTGEISYDTYWEIAMELNYGTKIMTMGSNITNLYGLPFLSTVIANGNAGSQIYAIRPGYNSTNVFPNYGWMYSEVAQPQFQTLEYDFWNPNSDALPGSANFSTTNANHLMITTVGNPNFQVAGYAKLAVANCYPGVYGYLGQYFTNAYAIDTNGNVTANTTGVLSPYGNFFATEPGPAALVTMPDVDFPYQRGTCAVYCVSLQVDKNSDGIMDLNFNGADATSQASPMVAWVNNWHTVQGINGNLDHDIEMVKNVLPNYAAGQITCQRDLENFFRLWICGMPTLPLDQGYTVTLSMSPSSGNPAINLYPACESDGGSIYLTDTNVAATQIGSAYYANELCTISNSQSYTLPVDGYGNLLFTHFLFEGAGIGEGQLMLTISQNGNVIAQTGVWLDLHDIKDLYEQAHTENIDTAPPSTKTSVLVEDKTLPANPAESQQVIVFVHGLNVGNWEYHDESETMFKRLYWQGYSGRFAAFDWPSPLFALIPTGTNEISYLGFNTGEYISWHSGTALKAYIDDLRNRLPEYTINLAVHSLGNVAANEAIREGAQVDNYVLMQAAISAGAFDGNNSALTYNYLAATAGSSPNANALGGYNNCFTNQCRRVNFYNDDDFALYEGVVLGVMTHTWEGNQLDYKPDTYIYFGGFNYRYSFDGTNCFYNEYAGNGSLLTSRTLTEDFEKKAYVARSRTKAVGAAGLAHDPNALTGGAITNNISLQNTSLGFIGGASFGNTRPEHSGEFTKPIQNTVPFYKELLKDGFLITPNP